MDTYEEILKKKIALFPPVGTVEDNLKPEESQIYRFDTECYRVTDKAILVGMTFGCPEIILKLHGANLRMILLKCDYQFRSGLS